MKRGWVRHEKRPLHRKRSSFWNKQRPAAGWERCVARVHFKRDLSLDEKRPIPTWNETNLKMKRDLLPDQTDVWCVSIFKARCIAYHKCTCLYALFLFIYICSYVYAQIWMYIHTYIYTRTYLYVQTHTHRYTCCIYKSAAAVRAHSQPPRRALYIYTYTHIHIHICIYTHTPTHPRAHTHTQKYIYLFIYMYVYIHT